MGCGQLRPVQRTASAHASRSFGARCPSQSCLLLNRGALHPTLGHWEGHDLGPGGSRLTTLPALRQPALR